MKFRSPEDAAAEELFQGVKSGTPHQAEENEHYQRARRIVQLIRKNHGLE